MLTTGCGDDDGHSSGLDATTRDDAASDAAAVRDMEPEDGGGGPDARADGGHVDAATPADGGGAEWPGPSCTEITGTGAVTFTRDEGATTTPRAVALEDRTYTFGLAATDVPGRMLAHSRTDVLLSEDSGCSWRPIGTFLSLASIVPARGGIAYVRSHEDEHLARIEGESVEAISTPAGVTDVDGLGVDPADAMHVRLGSGCRLHASRDGGGSWEPLGTPPGSDALTYDVDFDPRDFDHVVCAHSGGAWVTPDAGGRWIAATGGEGRPTPRLFSVSISLVDGNIAWAIGLEEPTLGDVRRFVYRSEDGGVTWRPVVPESDAVRLRNGGPITAHPTDPDVVYFSGIRSSAGGGAVEVLIHRWDASTGAEAVSVVTDTSEIDVITFAPQDARVMYLALEQEGPIT